MSMEDMHFNTGPAVPHTFEYRPALEKGVEDAVDAERLISEMLQKGERPIVTFPRDLLPAVREHGLQPRKSWVPGFDNVVGTLGIPPYRDNPERVTVRIKVDTAHLIQPRMTGNPPAFHGIVVFKSPVPVAQLEFIGEPPLVEKERPLH